MTTFSMSDWHRVGELDWDTVSNRLKVHLHRQHSAHRPILAEKALSLCTSRNVVRLDVNKQLANQLRLKESDEAHKEGGGQVSVASK